MLDARCWGNLPWLCLGAAIIELDGAHVGQWMVSRPLVLGPALGWACGDIQSGAFIGAVVEMLLASDLSVGSVVPLNGSVATAIAVLLTGGEARVEEAVAIPAALVAGFAHARIERGERIWRNGWIREIRQDVQDGKEIAFGTLMARAIGGHLFFTWAFLCVCLLVLTPGLSWGWSAAPEPVREGMRWAWRAAPWLAMARLVRVFWK
ncbi:MAG: PTS sugar transporter subunit IIC [Elusimicrobia bacterium]|nr:PTS sugar transporter subunit IIC [Elusimicrobiota bacterium]